MKLIVKIGIGIAMFITLVFIVYIAYGIYLWSQFN